MEDDDDLMGRRVLQVVVLLSSRLSPSPPVRVVTQQVAFSKGAQEKRKTQQKFVTSGQSSLFDDLLVRVFFVSFFPYQHFYRVKT